LPGVFIVVSAALLVNALYATPRQALTGMAIILAGLPFYWYWSRQLPAESK
jgi:APA family basic amino acid/polyamine antiporter